MIGYCVCIAALLAVIVGLLWHMRLQQLDNARLVNLICAASPKDFRTLQRATHLDADPTVRLTQDDYDRFASPEFAGVGLDGMSG